MTLSYTFLQDFCNKNNFKLTFDRATIGGKKYGIGIVSVQSITENPVEFKWTVWSSSSENNGSSYSGKEIIYTTSAGVGVGGRNEWHFTFPVNDGIDYFALVELVYETIAPELQGGNEFAWGNAVFTPIPSTGSSTGNDRKDTRLFETFRAETLRDVPAFNMDKFEKWPAWNNEVNVGHITDKDFLGALNMDKFEDVLTSLSAKTYDALKHTERGAEWLKNHITDQEFLDALNIEKFADVLCSLSSKTYPGANADTTTPANDIATAPKPSVGNPETTAWNDWDWGNGMNDVWVNNPLCNIPERMSDEDMSIDSDSDDMPSLESESEENEWNFTGRALGRGVWTFPKKVVHY